MLVDVTNIDSAKMLNGLVLQAISGTCTRGISIANARKVFIKNVSVTGYTGPLLTLANVTGHGLEGATQIPAPAEHPLVGLPPTGYKLH